jgi:hypothetical protein
MLKNNRAFAEFVHDNRWFVKQDGEKTGIITINNASKNVTSTDNSDNNSVTEPPPTISWKIKSLNELPQHILIKLDSRYNPLDDYQFIDHIINNNILEQHSITVSPNLRGFVITENIDSSVYCAVRLSEHYSCNVILMRAVGEPSYVITPQKMSEFDRLELTQEYLPKHYTKIDMTKNELPDVLSNHSVSIICGCYHRLKEGISVENAVWGICTKFIYSDISRAQILGRIRRTSNNPVIHNAKRIFLVNSGKVLTNEFQLMQTARKLRKPMNRNLIKTCYDFPYEKEVFERENYVYEVR